MKRCPTCEKTFEDNMRFCQTDGTELIDVVEELDPYKTMVAKPEDIAAAMASLSSEPAAEDESKEDEVLEIPAGHDPLKTMVASEEEIRAAMAASEQAEEPVMEIPPIAESEVPKPPQFTEPELTPPSFGGSATSGSLTGSLSNAPMPENSPLLDEFSRTSPPIPSPFSDMPAPASKDPDPSISPSEEPLKSNFEQDRQPPPASPFAEPVQTPFSNTPDISAGNPLTSAGSVEPDSSDKNMQQNQFNQQFPPAGGVPAAGGQSQTLAIISLVVGIVGLLCCSTLIVPAAAAILGFIARGKANSDPANYGGAGIATIGMILGVVGVLLGIAYLIFLIFFNGLAMLNGQF